jgi:hypothetical protein
LAKAPVSPRIFRHPRVSIFSLAEIVRIGRGIFRISPDIFWFELLIFRTNAVDVGLSGFKIVNAARNEPSSS